MLNNRIYKRYKKGESKAKVVANLIFERKDQSYYNFGLFRYYIHSPYFLIYNFLTKLAIKQYKIGKPIITTK